MILLIVLVVVIIVIAFVAFIIWPREVNKEVSSSVQTCNKDNSEADTYESRGSDEDNDTCGRQAYEDSCGSGKAYWS